MKGTFTPTGIAELATGQPPERQQPTDRSAQCKTAIPLCDRQQSRHPTTLAFSGEPTLRRSWT